MLIIAVVLAVIGLASLVAAVATSNEIFAWVCIASSAMGVILLAADAIRERKQRRWEAIAASTAAADAEAELAKTDIIETIETGETGEAGETGDGAEDAPDEIVHDEPEADMPSDDEPEYPEPAEEAAMHILEEDSTDPVVEDTAGEERSDER
ncbi:MAG: hypothetical protein FGM25_01900 [Mycobacterium sp.]|nr:hypothetical protein [Mycobacterium sp.]